MKILILLIGFLLPATEESEALRARSTALLELVVKHSLSNALAYVDEDSKDRFLELWGKGVPAYEISEVRVTGDQGQVIIKIDRALLFDRSMKVSVPMDWVRKNREWFLHVPDWDRLQTPFGRITPSGLISPQEAFKGIDTTPTAVDLNLVNEAVAKYIEEHAREPKDAAKESQSPQQSEKESSPSTSEKRKQ